MMKKVVLAGMMLATFSACEQKQSQQEAPKEVIAATKIEDTAKPVDQNLTKLGVKEQTLGKGLQVGDLAPEIAGTDQNGQQVSLKEMLASGPVAVVFYRGYWCPICNRELQGLQKNMDKITAAGGQLLVVTPELLAGAQKVSEKIDATFSIIPNAQQTINDYKVGFEVTEEYQEKIRKHLNEDIAKNNGADKASLPVPATFVIGTDGKVIYRQFDVNYKNRATAQDIADAMTV